MKVNGKDDIPYMKLKIKNDWNQQPDVIYEQYDISILPVYVCIYIILNDITNIYIVYY